MRICLWITFLLFSTNVLAQQLPANDPKLKIDPRDNRGDVPLYIQQSGLNKLAAALNTDPQHISQLVDQATDNMVVAGLASLRDRGFELEATSYEQQYNAHIKNWFGKHRDLFDHAPWSQFLVAFYQTLETSLGHEFCVFMHFDDLNEVNYAITVVFDPKNAEWDIVEYRKHFVPFAEAIAYWVSWTACEIITYGSMVTLICNPIATIIEDIMTCCVSPKISDSVYKRANGLSQ